MSTAISAVIATVAVLLISHERSASAFIFSQSIGFHEICPCTPQAWPRGSSSRHMVWLMIELRTPAFPDRVPRAM